VHDFQTVSPNDLTEECVRPATIPPHQGCPTFFAQFVESIAEVSVKTPDETAFPFLLTQNGES
jgi:hypothetical protein